MKKGLRPRPLIRRTPRLDLNLALMKKGLRRSYWVAFRLMWHLNLALMKKGLRLSRFRRRLSRGDI